MLRHVTAPDGVRIACDVGGEGPPLVIVHGCGSARWSFDMLRPGLEPRFTVWAVDRRGRGDSEDGDEYALEREYEDIAAVVREAGPDALLFGHSYGGFVAAGAAVQLDLPRLALYEPAIGGALVPADTIERWERLIEAGEPDTVVREFLRDITGYDDAAIDELARSPLWELRRAVLPTVPRELRAELAHRPDLSALAERDIPTLLLVGSESPPWAVSSVAAHGEALPSAETHTLEGHGHGANVTGPELLAAELRRFLLGS